jgi:hypothetical protein
VSALDDGVFPCFQPLPACLSVRFRHQVSIYKKTK